MQALAECYRNANNWQTGRQILSIMADKVSHKALQKWIPNLTRYRFSEARKYILVEGRGVAPSLQSSQTRITVSQTQLDHFLDFKQYLTVLTGMCLHSTEPKNTLENPDCLFSLRSRLHKFCR